MGIGWVSIVDGFPVCLSFRNGLIFVMDGVSDWMGIWTGFQIGNEFPD